MSEVPHDRHWVRLTHVCNQRCLFCLDRDAQDGTMMSVEAVVKELGAGRRAGLRRVVLSGGEPTVHPDFVKIVEAARSLGYTHIQTITNGRRFCYKSFLDAAVDAGLREVTFSLHGHTAPLHDRLTKVPGSFVQAVTALRHALAKPGLIVSVDVVINRLNLPQLRELLEFYIGMGVGEFDLLALVPFGDAWRNHSELFCDFSEPENLRALHRALEVSRRPGLHIWTNRLRPEFLAGFESLIQAPEKIFDELRGRRALFARFLAQPSGRMDCEGPSCGLCFLRDFCADLRVALGSGSLPARRQPGCLDGTKEREPDFSFDGPPDVMRFAEFYIRSRYFAKGGFCRDCDKMDSCDGMAVSDLRRTGGA